MSTATAATPRVDVYTRVTSLIVDSLEHGVRPWHKPWNAEHAAGRITRPLRHNGSPYRGINILMPVFNTFSEFFDVSRYSMGGKLVAGDSHGATLVRGCLLFKVLFCYFHGVTLQVHGAHHVFPAKTDRRPRLPADCREPLGERA